MTTIFSYNKNYTFNQPMESYFTLMIKSQWSKPPSLFDAVFDGFHSFPTSCCLSL